MVTSSAPCIFKHTSVGLKEFGKGRAAAAVNYQTNVNKCEKILTVNLPNCNRHALREAVERYEAALPRKDSRVAEIFTVGFDRQLLPEHREMVAQRYLWRMTAFGQSRAWAALHHNDPGNPHAHIGYLDRHIETGRSVQLMTGTPRSRKARGMEATGTEFARRVWADAHNSVYADFGYERHMDHRSLARQQEAANENANRVYEDVEGYDKSTLGHPAAWQKQDDAIAVNEAFLREMESSVFREPSFESKPEPQHVIETEKAAENEVYEEIVQLPVPPHAPTHELAESPASAHEQELVQEDEMAEDRHPALDPEHPDFVDEDAAPSGPATVKTGATPMGVKAQVTAAHQFAQNVQTVRKARHELTTLRQSFETALKSAQAWKGIAEKEARKTKDYELATAEAHGAMRAHLNENGKMRGFSLFGMRTPARKRAEAAAHNVVRAQRAENDHVVEVARLTKVATERTRAAEIASARLKGFDLQLAERKLGNEQDMAQAETIFLLSQREAVATLRPVEVYRAWEDGVVEPEEALSALSALGDMEYAKAIEASMEQEQGEGLGA